jgi:hypothetical protein
MQIILYNSDMREQKLQKLIISILLLTLIGLGGSQVFAQGLGGVRYFPETGHWVTGDFLDRYESVSDPLHLFGLPITDEFVDKTTGLTIQYFKKVRFELHPEAPPELRVQLSPLGDYLYIPGDSLTLPPNVPACRSFPETGYEVCFAFEDFFESEGGIGQFGYPISNFEVHENLIVQYFQRARFEWHPEELPEGGVSLSNLGLRYFYVRGEDIKFLIPHIDDRNDIPRLPTLSLRVNAFPNSAIMPLKGNQTIFVIVQDQNYQPIDNAQVTLQVELPDGQQKNYVMRGTNAKGISILDFPVNGKTQGLVKVTVSVISGGLHQDTQTSFILWW